MPERPQRVGDDGFLRDIRLRWANEAWLEKHRAELLSEFAGRYVAILDERVVAEDPDFVRLLARLGKEHPTVDPFVAAIEFLSEDDAASRTRARQGRV